MVLLKWWLDLFFPQGKQPCQLPSIAPMWRRVGGVMVNATSENRNNVEANKRCWEKIAYKFATAAKPDQTRCRIVQIWGELVNVPDLEKTKTNPNPNSIFQVPHSRPKLQMYHLYKMTVFNVLKRKKKEKKSATVGNGGWRKREKEQPLFFKVRGDSWNWKSWEWEQLLLPLRGLATASRQW